MTRSVDGRELGMSPTLPFRPGELGGQFREPEVEVRRARMDPVMDRLSAAFAAKDVEGEEKDVEWEWVEVDSSSRSLPFVLPYWRSGRRHGGVRNGECHEWRNA